MPYTPRTIYFRDGNYIRLLVLAPGNFDDPIACDFLFASVFRLPKFEALSYCWGDQRNRDAIHLCGITYLVTKNLLAALRYLRYENQPRVLWVDALCINQADSDELNHQILHMRTIYSQATSVVAWVGGEEWNGADAFDAICRQVQGTWTSTGTIDAGALAVIHHFLSSPYWDRLWIVQEVALASEITIVCGYNSLPWSVVQDLFRPNQKGQILPDGLPYHMRRGIWRLRHLWHTRERLNDPAADPTLLQILNKFNPCKCFLPKDSLYAVLGMASNVVRQLILPDYSEDTTLEDVFRQATIACILEQQNLDVLSHVRRWADYSKHTHYGEIARPPATETSWAGEWSTGRIIRPLVEPDLAVQLYAAAPAALGCFTKDNLVLQSGSTHILKLDGILFDTLHEVAELINPYEPGWESLVHRWEPERLDTYKYPTGENAIDAFWRCLLSDLTYAKFYPDHKRNTPEHIEDYRRLFLEWSGRSGIPEEDNAGRVGRDDRSFKDCLEWGSNFNSLQGWTFATTTKGYFVRCQPDAIPGDHVAFVYGSVVPLILRAVEPPMDVRGGPDGKKIGPALRLVSSAYVHGLMDGEVFHASQEYDVQNSEIFLY